MSDFEKLYRIDVNERTEKKGGLTYLSWSWAWAEFVKHNSDATYTVLKNEQGLPYFKDESGAFCFTTVRAGGITHEMWLPVMDNKNKALKDPDAFEVNKTIMRCLTKNLAMFGLGLYIYAGEDLPEAEPLKPLTENDFNVFQSTEFNSMDVLQSAYSVLLKRCQTKDEQARIVAIKDKHKSKLNQ